MENQNINEQPNTEALPGEETAEVKKSGGLSTLLGKLDSVSETGLNKVLHNMPLVLFLFLLASLRIANNNMADNYARNITKTEKQVKELRWQYMTTTSDLMKKSRQSEVAQLMKKLGTNIKELRIPPYKIEVKKN